MCVLDAILYIKSDNCQANFGTKMAKIGYGKPKHLNKTSVWPKKGKAFALHCLYSTMIHDLFTGLYLLVITFFTVSCYNPVVTSPNEPNECCKVVLIATQQGTDCQLSLFISYLFVYINLPLQSLQLTKWFVNVKAVIPKIPEIMCNSVLKLGIIILNPEIHTKYLTNPNYKIQCECTA